MNVICLSHVGAGHFFIVFLFQIDTAVLQFLSQRACLRHAAQDSGIQENCLARRVHKTLLLKIAKVVYDSLAVSLVFGVGTLT